MYQNTCVDFKLGHVDAKSDAIVFCVKTYPSSSFIKNRMNMHEMQNRMKITFCVILPLPSILLALKGAPREVFGGASVGLATALFIMIGISICKKTPIEFLITKYTFCMKTKNKCDSCVIKKSKKLTENYLIFHFVFAVLEASPNVACH